MKNLLYILALLFAVPVAQAQIDRSKAPGPGNPKEIQLGEYKTFKLKNGLTVIVVENHELPTVSFSLQLNLEPMIEGKVAGTASFAGQLLRTGTTTRTKSQIDKEIDFIGASLGSSQSGVFGSGLKKHQDKILELMTDILYNPVFPAEEFDKLRKQTLSALAMNASDPNAISSTVAGVLRYGKEHPYGEPVTEETVQAITLDGIREYYQSYFKPGIAYLVMVGDLTPKEGKVLAEKYFRSWKPGKVTFSPVPEPVRTEKTRVALVDKPGAVQSVVTITHTIRLKPGEPDALPAALMNTILGGGVFSGRLMMNLREDKAYTYGAQSSLSSNRYVGSFTAGAQVGTAVTDSAINEFLYEIRRLQEEFVTEEDLRMNKDVMAGEFARALESPSTVAGFALNTILYSLPKDYYATYLERLEKITREEIQAMAKKYLQPDNCIILVVGNKSAIAEKLVRFDATGAIGQYDRYGNPLEQAPLALAEGITARTVIDQYLQAIGGKQALAGVKQITSLGTMKVEAMGRTMDLAFNSYQEQGKLCQEMLMGDRLLSKQAYDGTQGWMAGMGNVQEVTGKDLETLKENANLFAEMFYDQPGYDVKLTGMETLEGKRVYHLEVKTPTGALTQEYYDVASGYKIRSVRTVEMQGTTVQNISDISDYREVEGIKIPFQIKQSIAGQVLELRLEKVDLKTPIDPARFRK